MNKEQCKRLQGASKIVWRQNEGELAARLRRQLRTYSWAAEDLVETLIMLKKLAPNLLTTHRWRGTFATWALRGGMDLFSPQCLLGHSSLEVVRRYAKQSDRDLKITHDKVGPIDNTL